MVNIVEERIKRKGKYIFRIVILVLFCCALITYIPDAQAQDNVLPVYGFIDYAVGSAVDPAKNMANALLLNEVRAQFQWDPRPSERGELHFVIEVLLDEVVDESAVELREAYIYLFPSDRLEMKIGRQILTWGVGDFIFINDLFPKNWQSFFIGRDDAYLKDSSTSLKTSWFPEQISVDLIWTPVFSSDTFIDGGRLNFFDFGSETFNGGSGSSIMKVQGPSKEIENSEIALRLRKNVSSTELAFYGYYGFYKRPLGFDPAAKKNIFPELAVYGTSIRGNLWKGIGKIELGYYDSLNDCSGDNPFIENSDIKGLVGYSQEVVKDLTLSFQYYLEYMLHHDRYTTTFPNSKIQKDESRHVFTLRATQLLKMQTLVLSFFGFYSPSDEDTYLRPSISYQWTDQIGITCGGNIFWGTKDHTFFGMFENDTNIYARLRYGF